MAVWTAVWFVCLAAVYVAASESGEAEAAVAWNEPLGVGRALKFLTAMGFSLMGVAALSPTACPVSALVVTATLALVDGLLTDSIADGVVDMTCLDEGDEGYNLKAES